MGRLNKSAQPGYTYRSPNQTNANDLLPNLSEDVVASQSADNERIRRGMDTSSTRPQNRAQVQNAAGRAITRSLGRANAAGLALQGGYEAGRYIDEKTGAGKKLVEATGLGRATDAAVNKRDKATLTKDAKQRLEDHEDAEIARDVDEKIAGEKATKREVDYKKGGMARGWGKARGARAAKVY